MCSLPNFPVIVLNRKEALPDSGLHDRTEKDPAESFAPTLFAVTEPVVYLSNSLASTTVVTIRIAEIAFLGHCGRRSTSGFTFIFVRFVRKSVFLKLLQPSTLPDLR
jgi:hypothetical protein